VLKRKSGVENKVVDAFTHVCCLLHTRRIEILGFDRLKGLLS